MEVTRLSGLLIIQSGNIYYEMSILSREKEGDLTTGIDFLSRFVCMYKYTFL